MRKSLVQQIKSRYTLAATVAPYTGGLKPSGRGFFIGRCPFHQKPDSIERKFWVNSRTNTCGCFVPRCPAYCNRSEDPHTRPLDVINFLALVQGISNAEALERLKGEL